MNFRKIVYYISIALGSMFLLVFLFVSPIAKYVIENNSEDWTGRKITIESLWINILNGSIHIEDFKFYESNSDKVFVSFADFYCNIEVTKLLSGKYFVSPITLSKPEVNILQSGSKFNFDDLIKRFADTTDTKPDVPSEPVKYFLENFSIQGGTVNYTTTTPPTSISLFDLNITSAPISYSDSIYDIESDFRLKSGGNVNLIFNLNANSLAYGLRFKADKYKLNLIAAYIKDVLKLKSINGTLNTDLNIAGNFNRPQEVSASGSMEITDFSIIDTTGEDLCSFDSYKMSIDSLNTKAGIYNFEYIILDKPHVKFGIYEDGTNFDRVIVTQEVDSTSAAPIEEYTNIFQMLAGYIRSLSTEYLLNEYHVEKLALNYGHIIFTDYTLEDKFRYDLDSLHVKSDNLNSKNERILISLSSRLNNSGFMSGTLSINPDGFRDMDINYSVKDLLISDINPYSKYYVATPFLDGTIFFENNTSILDNKLKSTNKLFIEHIVVGNKTHTKGVMDLPVKLAVSILRDHKGNIDFKIPVEGDLDDPTFKIGPVIWQIFKNLIIKAALAPYKLIADSFGGNEEDYREIQYQYLQRDVTEEQSKTIRNLVNLLKDKPDLGIEFVQFNNKVDEKEQLAIYKTKQQYLGYSHDSLTAEQHLQVLSLSNKDSAFVTWVDSTLGSSAQLTSIQEKCVKRIGNERLITEVDFIMEQRNSKLQGFFTSNGIAPERVKVSNVKDNEQATKESIPRYVISFFSFESTSANPETSAGTQK